MSGTDLVYLGEAIHESGVEVSVGFGVIRSGQDWSDAEGAEREMYLNDVERILREDMDFLRGEGGTIGCYANQYVTVVTPDGGPIERSYGMNSWRRVSPPLNAGPNRIQRMSRSSAPR